MLFLLFLATSGVVFNTFLLDILCSFPGVWSLSVRSGLPLVVAVDKVVTIVSVSVLIFCVL